MEDRIFDLFRELVNGRDGELARLLGVSRVPVRRRASSSSSSIPGHGDVMFTKSALTIFLKLLMFIEGMMLVIIEPMAR